mmetsp:Transcript_40506/g.65695  ORF Transcript_40506/g.65695 Transcript_40506/m.65695 type:complete len:184 (+) Transcript_40506:2279-2830(+)
MAIDSSARLSLVERLTVLWYFIDTLTHIVLEGAFVFVSLLGTVNESKSILALPWKEYAKADLRWGISDPTVVSIELITVVLDGLLAAIMVDATMYRRPWKHVVQIILCTCELYGDWMTFAPEWLSGNTNLSNQWHHVYIYLWFCNGIWVVVPLFLLTQSCLAISSLETGRAVKRSIISRSKSQ